ncbi:unnamed protein product [marine sediment metagenome]|uniref:Uncharacterized protein n=1 Tax=marine sediment metagenome TaxID=412755 RepID=X0SUW1_9ZZZZ
MKKIFIAIIIVLSFNYISFAGSQEANKRYIEKLIKHGIITQQQLDKNKVIIRGDKGDTEIIKKKGKVYIKRISKKQLQKRLERELKRKIRENEGNIEELRKELERLKRRRN